MSGNYKKYKEFYAIGLYILFLAAFGYFIIMPLYAKIQAKRDGIQQKELDQQSREQKVKELESFKQRYAEIQNTQKQFDVLLSEDQAVVLIERLESLAAETGNKITIAVKEKNVQSQPAAKTEKDVKKEPSIMDKLPSQNILQLDISLEGTYNSVAQFFMRLESFSYYSDIVGFQITKKDDGLNNQTGQTSSAQAFRNPFYSGSDTKKDQNEDEQKAQSEPASANPDAVGAVINCVFYLK